MIKLIATDLDNTLLDENSEVTPEIKDTIAALKAKGVYVTVVSGRAFPSAAEIAAEIGSNTPVICYNGSVIRSVDGADTVYSQGIPIYLACELIQYCRDRDLYIQMYENDIIKTDCRHNDTRYDPDQKRGRKQYIDDMMDLAKRVISPKLLAVAPSSLAQKYIAELEELYGDRAYFAQSESYLIEMMPKGVSKGISLDILAGRLGVAKDEIMTLGDNTNDATFLNHGGIAVAVANAVPSIKAMADYICEGKRDKGWIEAVNKFVLGKQA